MSRLATRGSLARVEPVPAETVNVWTHGFGWCLSLLGASAMMQAIISRGDVGRVWGCGVYVLSLIALYAASTLSHSFEDRRRILFRMLDQVCIFLLVAGSFTPFALVHLRDGLWWVLLAVMWGVALTGIVARIRSGERTLHFGWYVALGWMPVLTLERIVHVAGLPGLALVLAGGLAYTGGTWFLNNDHRHPYFHAVWHLCTILGSALHYVFLYRYVALWPIV
jgi:hemolysin III